MFRRQGACRAGIITLVFAVLADAALSQAQVPDHLKCYKVKDPAPKVEYTADLGGLAPEPGCLIKMPAKMVCVEATKTNVTPSPPGAPAGSPAGRFVCYAVKCPKAAAAPLPVGDQFGTRDLQPGRVKLLCAPAAPSTTTTTASTTTTTNGLPNGSSCSSGTQCSSGFCENNVCCSSSCSSSQYCSSSSSCTAKKSNGTSCGAAYECLSGFCVSNAAGTEDICCFSSCGGTCCSPSGTSCATCL